MNARISKFLLAGEKIMPEMHLSICELQKTKKECKNSNKQQTPIHLPEQNRQGLVSKRHIYNCLQSKALWVLTRARLNGLKKFLTKT